MIFVLCVLSGWGGQGRIQMDLEQEPVTRSPRYLHPMRRWVVYSFTDIYTQWGVTTCLPDTYTQCVGGLQISTLNEVWLYDSPIPTPNMGVVYRYPHSMRCDYMSPRYLQPMWGWSKDIHTQWGVTICLPDTQNEYRNLNVPHPIWGISQISTLNMLKLKFNTIHLELLYQKWHFNVKSYLQAPIDTQSRMPSKCIHLIPPPPQTTRNLKWPSPIIRAPQLLRYSLLDAEFGILNGIFIYFFLYMFL